MRLAMEKIAYCKYSDWCLTDPWRRQQNDVTSVAITGGRDLRRHHIGRNAITSRTASVRDVMAFRPICWDPSWIDLGVDGYG
jgi:hypothetical protein